jgi:hypothetical protein
MSPQDALRALAPLTATHDRDGSAITEALAVEPAPLPADPERLLPVVHVVWGFLVPGLTSAAESAPRVEAAAALLSELAIVSGSFITRRMRERVLPGLRRILSGGGVRRAAGDGAALEAGTAPATVARCRLAVLGMLARAGADAQGSQALKGSVDELAMLVLPFLGGVLAGLELGRAAHAAMHALARIDPDAVWLVLFSAVHTATGPALKGWQAPAPPQPPSDLKDWRASVLRYLTPVDVPAPSLRWGSASTTLLHEVEAMVPAWHASF